MILGEIVLLGLLLSLITGGSLKRLQAEPLKGEWLLLALLPVQVLWPRVASSLGLECVVSMLIWLVLMAALAGVCLWNAPQRWPLAIAGLGIALNILVIGLNSAMPVDIRAASEIGVPRATARMTFEIDCLHKELTSDTRLPVLADVIAVPGPRWQRGVVSAGDLMLALGLAGWVFAGSRPLQLRSG